MKKKPLILILIAAVALPLLVWALFISNLAKTTTQSPPDKPLGTVKKAAAGPSHPLVFWDENGFYKGVAQSEKETKNPNYKIAGGIIPHHLLPGFIIADFFNRLSAQDPTTVILLGPNHEELGDFEVLTSLYGWQTPFGAVQPNYAIINSLIGINLAKVDEEVLAQETSVTAIVPFIKFYLPEAKIVPLILSARMTQDETRTLANDLKNRFGYKTVVVAAVDFSHYLTSPVAKEKDELTWQAMKNFDYRQLFTLNSDYLDSSPSIATLLMVMQKRSATNLDLLYHTNSGELLKDSSISTTSYFSIAFH